MITVRTQGHIGADGSLSLQVFTGLPESDVEVVVVVQPRSREGVADRMALAGRLLSESPPQRSDSVDLLREDRD
jgi:hypothetical protein